MGSKNGKGCVQTFSPVVLKVSGIAPLGVEQNKGAIWDKTTQRRRERSATRTNRSLR